MRTFFTYRHLKRDARTELSGGQLIAPHECPARATMIRDRLIETGCGDIVEPQPFGLTPILRVHDENYVHFLETAWDEWKASGALGEAIPIIWPARRMSDKIPRSITGRLGYYALAAETSISEGTWEAARGAADVALSAASHVANGGGAAFALCRPPGHHAARDLFGGYCFLNNAALATQSLRDQGAARCAILDVDFHHGNGTQDIFYQRGDVFFASIHGDPYEAFPYFLGHADEVGVGPGEGANANFPLARGADWAIWETALIAALEKIQKFGAEALVVSLGVDAFEGDPISFFKLRSADFLRMGEAIGRLGLPTVFVMEGGYAVAEIGVNAVNVLTGFESV